MKNPTLSIIVPVYNASATLGRLVDEILGQSFTDFELILVNDGSTDSSSALIKNFATKDRRVVAIDKENGGPSSARNRGLRAARGKYIMFADADDEIEAEIYGKMLAGMTPKIDLVTCGIKQRTIKNDRVAHEEDVYQSDPRREKNENFKDYILRLLGSDGRLYHPANKLYRREIIARNGLKFEEDLNFGEDLTFNLSYLKHCRDVAFVRTALYIYNLDADSGTFGKSSLVFDNRVRNYRSLLKFADPIESEKTRDLVEWIKYYWFYSFALAIISSKLSNREKRRRLKEATHRTNFRRGMKNNIGRKKFTIEKLLDTLKNHVSLLILFIKFISGAKNNRVFSGLWRQIASRTLSR
jgi:glycosyltransferase involved in cell wall biosynthesis